MASELGEPIAALEREARRLEALLAGDESWRRLSALDQRQAGRGLLGTIEEALERQELRERLATHRIFAARQLVLDAVALLKGQAELADRPRATGPSEAPRPGARSAQRLVDRLAVAGAEATAVLRAERALVDASAVSPDRPPRTLSERAAGSAVGPETELDPERPNAAMAPLQAKPDDAPPVRPPELTAIRGVDAALAASLAVQGVTTFAAVAAWRREDVRRIREVLGLQKRRISRECWIEQAAILAAGRETAYSAARRRHHFPVGESLVTEPSAASPPGLPGASGSAVGAVGAGETAGGVEAKARAAALFTRTRTFPPGRSLLAAIEAAEASLRRGPDSGGLPSTRPTPPRTQPPSSGSMSGRPDATDTSAAHSPANVPTAPSREPVTEAREPTPPSTVAAPVPTYSAPSGQTPAFPSAPRLRPALPLSTPMAAPDMGRPPSAGAGTIGAAAKSELGADRTAQAATPRRPGWLDREAAARTVPLLFEDEADVAIVFKGGGPAAPGSPADPALAVAPGVPPPGPDDRAAADAPLRAPSLPQATLPATAPPSAPPPAAYSGQAEEASVEIVRLEGSGRSAAPASDASAAPRSKVDRLLNALKGRGEPRRG